MLVERVKHVVEASCITATDCFDSVLQFTSKASCDTENVRWKTIGDWGNLEGKWRESDMLLWQVVRWQLMVVTGSYNSNPPIGGWATPRAHSPPHSLLGIHFVVKR